MFTRVTREEKKKVAFNGSDFKEAPGAEVGQEGGYKYEELSKERLYSNVEHTAYHWTAPLFYSIL